MKRRGWLAVIALASALPLLGSGCGGLDYTSVRDGRNFHTEQKFWVKEFYVDKAEGKIQRGEAYFRHPGKVLSQDLARETAEELKDRFLKADVIVQPDDGSLPVEVSDGLIVEGEVLLVDEGSQVGRYFLGGHFLLLGWYTFGHSTVTITGRVVNAADGKVVAEFTSSRWGSFGFLGGYGPHLINEDVIGHAVDIATWLAGLCRQR